MNHSATRVIVPLFIVSIAASAIAAGEQTFEAKTAQLIGGATRESRGDGSVPIALNAPNQGLVFAGLPAAGKMAIHYGSVRTGTISVSVNGRPAQKVNVHSSGSLTNSFLNAIIDIAIPANATLAISLNSNDIPVDIDRIIVGDGNLGLPPDIWNLPPLPISPGPYSPDWKEISKS